MADLPGFSLSESSATWPSGGVNDGKRPPLPTSFRPEKRGRAANDADPSSSISSSSSSAAMALGGPASPSGGPGGPGSASNLPHLASWKSTTSSTDGDVNTGTYTRVHLKVKAQSRLGETVHCSGSSFVMGHFNPNESMTLVTTPEDYPYWTTVKPMILPRGVPHQYMYALFSGGVFSSWEQIECERVLVPEGREMVVVEHYGDYDQDMELVATGERIDRSLVYERRQDETAAPPTPNAAEAVAMEQETGDDVARDAAARLAARVAQDKDEADPKSPRSSVTGTPTQRFRQTNKLQSRYKRYMPSSYHPSPDAMLFLVCYHLPVKLTKSADDGSWSVEWNRDSLISRSENSIAESMNTTWVGCVTYHARSDQEELSEDDKSEITVILADMNCIPVFIDRQLAANHHGGYCKSKLWPMFHNVDILDIYYAIWDRAEVIEWKEERNNGEWWDAYQKVNRLLADRVGELCKENDTVWVHDYHLLLFPSYLANTCRTENRKRPKMVFFLHVPFPTSEVFRELSHGTQLLEGVLDVDIVGFHSFDHARHFLNACKRFLGLTYQSRRGGNLGVDYRGRNVIITISHVGIETTLIREVIESPEVQEMARKLREKHAGKVLIAGVDVCQRLSGIPLKMLAFEQFFSNCPSWKDKLVFVERATLTQTRLGDQNYSSNEIRKLVDRITKAHGPECIDYEESSSPLTIEERLALWLASDILMVTSIREGLNLKPLEFVFAKGINPSNRPGVVILSEFSACCCVLNGAVRVNPWNITGLVNSLDHALTMSDEERLGRRARDLPYITNQPAANWTKQVLSVLHEATDNAEGDEEYTNMEYMDMEIGRSHVMRVGDRSDFKQLNIDKVMEAYMQSKRRVFLLDYGGTIIARENISMYVKKDFTAVTGKRPSPRMMDALTHLTKDPRNTVFVVSGVTKSDLTASLGHIRGLGLVSDNGALYSWARSIDIDNAGDVTMQDDSNPSDRHWHQHSFKFDWRPVREAVDPILKVYCTRTNGSVLRYAQQSIAWNFRSTDPEWGLLQANSLQNDLEEVIRDLPVNVVRKKGLLEIVPEGLNKGVVARQILTQDASISHGHPDFLFCIGDDTTDESMFKAIYDYYAERTEESVHGRAGNGTFEDFLASGDEGPLHHVFTCTVGKKPSNAHLYVNNVDEVEQLLQALGKTSDPTEEESPTKC
ncbi:Alpha,alpha-trehalose-phosphate synthase [UDP-forming] 5 [Phytophthora rubi]|uniref:Alpha,alpha-trehalose-phosphate synthase [UDP-forming] 5 n=1 Tax=Phytophthora rubi TaxID=129364 RepID=A0A6A3N8S2_9STRA|nr:Alpha,alpha-trehalose-phosphate synthase [UDP-forming] 5 [Phytophthora rubi]KAE9347852.1 Alpha,alpha-trehalose-phosphate synthase [UDP-forming] 5 [Phytophthora rubi]